MKKRWTRRKFLQTSLKSTIAVGAGAACSAPLAAQAARPQRATAAGFQPDTRTLLSAAMDEIIPAADDMPAASEVGGVEYLDRLARQDSRLKREFEKGLAALERICSGRFQRSFARLSRAERVEALRELEKRGGFFATLRDYVYEAYYTQPQVWKRIGYEPYPTHQAGPPWKPFDEAVLAKVRKMPKLYREVER